MVDINALIKSGFSRREALRLTAAAIGAAPADSVLPTPPPSAYRTPQYEVIGPANTTDSSWFGSGAWVKIIPFPVGGGHFYNFFTVTAPFDVDDPSHNHNIELLAYKGSRPDVDYPPPDGTTANFPPLKFYAAPGADYMQDHGQLDGSSDYTFVLVDWDPTSNEGDRIDVTQLHYEMDKFDIEWANNANGTNIDVGPPPAPPVLPGATYNLVAQADGSLIPAWVHSDSLESVASEKGAHAEGWDTSAFALASHAEGQGTRALGDYSHAQGQGSVALGQGSFAAGMDAHAYRDYEFALGGGLGMYSVVFGSCSTSNTAQTAVLGVWDGVNGVYGPIPLLSQGTTVVTGHVVARSASGSGALATFEVYAVVDSTGTSAPQIVGTPVITSRTATAGAAGLGLAITAAGDGVTGSNGRPSADHVGLTVTAHQGATDSFSWIAYYTLIQTRNTEPGDNSGNSY